MRYEDVRAARQDRKKERARKRLETQEIHTRKRTKTPRPFEPLTDRQADYAEAIKFSTYIFALGPAGTGKTYVAACAAADHLENGGNVILTRPAVEAAGEKLGFLPGDLSEKFGPYMKPLMRILIERLGQGFVETAIKNERIQMIPLAFMRGETFKGALIIADEMQNATKEQHKMLLTRIGEGSRMIIDGDPAQSDIGETSGLQDAAYRLQDLGGVTVVRFTRSDVVRHDIIQNVIERYEK